MKKSISYLLAVIVAALFTLMPAGKGVDYYFDTGDCPSNVVMSHTFPSNDEYEWSIDFAGRTSAASDWLVRNISASPFDTYAGFNSIPEEGFGVTRLQAYQAVIGSTRGTAMAAWSEAARQYADPLYTTTLARDTLWDKIKFTLDGEYVVPDPDDPSYLSSQLGTFVWGTPYLYNLNTITGVGFANMVDSALMNVSGIANQLIGKRLGDLRSARSEICCDSNIINRFWASPFVTVHEESDREGYAPFRYKAVGGALGYDQSFGPLTFGGAAFYSRGRYQDKWSWGNGNTNTSDHYGLSVYGNWYVTEKVFFNGHAGYQRSLHRIRRELVGANGDYLTTKTHTGAWWLTGKAGYDFGPWRNVTVTPSIGLEYRRADNRGFTVSDSMGIPFLEVDTLKRHRFLMPVDVTAQYRLAVCDALSMTFRAGGGYTHDFNDRGAEGTMRYAGMNQSVAIRNGKPKVDDWNVHLGANFTFRERWEFDADYRYEGVGGYGYTGTFVFNF